MGADFNNYIKFKIILFNRMSNEIKPGNAGYTGNELIKPVCRYSLFRGEFYLPRKIEE